MGNETDNMRGKQIICLNFGSTSSEVACLSKEGMLIRDKICHDDALLSRNISDQIEERKRLIMSYLKGEGVVLQNTDAVACRGGRLSPIPSGVYLVENDLLQDSMSARFGDHASRLSALVGADLASLANCPAFVVDPISVDEMTDVAKVSGLKGLERRSLGHFLNSKFVARKYCEENGLDYGNANLIVAHLGGGATISAHKQGKVVDLINDFEGAFSPDRSGTLPNFEIVNLCEKFGIAKTRRFIEGEGGIFSYTGSKDFSLLEQRALSGDAGSLLLVDAYVYQHKKSIAAMMSVLAFEVEALILTGGISHSHLVQRGIFSTFSKLTSCVAYPGSFEVEALIREVYLALCGHRMISHYHSL